jgi:protein-disulfide isomerase-like protein with CxxC motif
MNWQAYPVEVRHVAADIIFREGLRKRQYPQAYARAAALYDSNPALRTVVAAYMARTADTRDMAAAVQAAEVR